MNPILIATGVFGAIKLLEWIFSGDDDSPELAGRKILLNYLVDADASASEDSVIKTQVTKTVNKLISSCNGFKIGKSGNPKTRAYSYQQYNNMYVLCSSNSVEFIEDLEAYYNDKFIDHSKNDNQRTGSAGESVAANGSYYLYIVVR